MTRSVKFYFAIVECFDFILDDRASHPRLSVNNTYLLYSTGIRPYRVQRFNSLVLISSWMVKVNCPCHFRCKFS